MRPISLLLPAVLSLALASLPAAAQRRPRFGGTLRIEVRDRPASPDAPSPWFSSVYETLVRLDEKGRPHPQLAASWSHDEQRKRWIFAPRKGVKLHSGAEWSPTPASLTFADDRAIEDLLADLARPANAVLIPQPAGPPLGTGPFKIAEWEPSNKISLAAHEQHWEGRPFLDAIEIRVNRSFRDQSQSFELNEADIVEARLTDVRRLRGPQLSLSPPAALMAIAAARPVRGLSAAIDRPSIHGVLLQKQGDPAGSLLPQFLSGVAFLFPFARDLATAKTQAAGSPPLTFYYDQTDPLPRSIGERIVLNASEAGLTLKASASPNADLRLALYKISSTNPAAALKDLAAALGLAYPAGADAYAAERTILDTNRVVPLFHVPAAHRVNLRVRNWIPSDAWPLAGVWLDETGVRP